MSIYRKVLLVVALDEHAEKIGARARDIATLCNSELSILHVVEYVPVEPMGETLLPAVQIEEELVQRAKQRLAELAKRLGIESARREVAAGNIKAEIVRAAQEQKADLIVLGSRERRGPSILVNFTEDTVLHAAPCDVLAVRLRKDAAHG
jgi:universal stress protein A